MDKKKVNELTERVQKAFCINHTGKMEGMLSLSTSCLDNPFCRAHKAVQGSICQHCFAQSLMQCRKSMQPKYKRNGDFLKYTVVAVSDMPLLNCLYFRFEAFGDLETVFQVQNYFNLCRRNPRTHFALWTKNPIVIDTAMKLLGLKKPSNLVILVSSIMINKRMDVSRYPFVDKVFTVYTKDYAEEHKININCGARCCLTCGRCYSKHTGKEVNELLK